jgi:hypothetical protein
MLYAQNASSGFALRTCQDPGPCPAVTRRGVAATALRWGVESQLHGNENTGFQLFPDLSHNMNRIVMDNRCDTWLTTSVRNPELGISEDIFIRQNLTLKIG